MGQLLLEMTLPMAFHNHLSKTAEDYGSIVHKSLRVLRFFVRGLAPKARGVLPLETVTTFADRAARLLEVLLERDCEKWHTVHQALGLVFDLQTFALKHDYQIESLATLSRAKRLLKRVQSSEVGPFPDLEVFSKMVQTGITGR